MAHFIAPTSGNINADYHVDNRMAAGSIGRMIIPPKGEADIILGWCPDSLKVLSNNRQRMDVGAGVTLAGKLARQRRAAQGGKNRMVRRQFVVASGKETAKHEF
jgi:hypothetical protein